MGTLHDNLCAYMIVPLSAFLRVRNVSDKSFGENQSTHFMFNNPPPESRAFCEVMWKNIVELDRRQMTIWRMRIACWIPKATDTHSEYVMLFHCNSGYTNAPQCYVHCMSY